MISDTTNKRVVVKIGSTSLTSQHGQISRRKLEKLVDEVVRLKDNGHEVLLVSSGAVAAGYRKLGFLQRPTALTEKQAAASIGQGLLMEAYSELFLSHGYVASQILITRDDFSDEDRYNNVRNTINILLERGIVPIINENDTVAINQLKFGDNDTLSAKVAGLVDADMLIILSDIDGLYDADPRKHPHAKRFERVYNITPDIEQAAGAAGSAIGTGGMKSKIDAFKIAIASGIPSFLGKASTPDILYDAVYQKAPGTYFEVTTNAMNLNLKKQWIAFNSGPRGEVIVDMKAKNAIMKKKGSLFLPHIQKIKGRFNHGEVVKITDSNDEPIGLGVVNYSSEKLLELQNLPQAKLAAHQKPIVDSEQLVCQLHISVPINL